MGNRRICELCNNEAVVYCVADSAFLCLSCDAKVHGANFLVARHVRKIVCSNCEDFTGDHVSGVGLQVKALICRSCSPTELGSGELDSLSSSSSSACVLGALKRKRDSEVNSLPAVVNGGHKARFGIDAKMVGIFVRLCKRFGVIEDDAAGVVRMACNGLAVGADKLTVLPFRVCIVASLWFGLRFSGIKSLCSTQALTRLELITGVPAKLISAAESKVGRLYKAAKQQQNNLESENRGQLDKLELLKEDWAEST